MSGSRRWCFVIDSHKDESGLPPNVGGTVVTVGTFDGVHRGHQLVLRRLAQRAREVNLKSVLVTFDPHPLEIINPSAAPPLLTTSMERTEVLAESGIDYLAVVPFTQTLRGYPAEAFVDVILRDRFRMQELLIGHDHGFGRGREGDVEVLQALGARRGFRVEVIEAVSLGDGRPISSTSIRRAVAGGDLQRAAAGLGRPYGVSGVVIAGEQRGRLLGFPTLNLGAPSPRKLLPPEGVYAVRVQTPAGPLGGMMNLGPRPTFGDSATSLEVHAFDGGGDWYGASIRVDFIARLRDTMKFAGPPELIAQLRQDAVRAKAVLAANSVDSPVLLR